MVVYVRAGGVANTTLKFGAERRLRVCGRAVQGNLAQSTWCVMGFPCTRITYMGEDPERSSRRDNAPQDHRVWRIMQGKANDKRSYEAGVNNDNA